MVTPPDQTGVVSTALNARTVGSGSETIVLAHGFGTDQSIWDKVVPLLAQNYRLVLFDWPFSGALNKQLRKTMFDPLKYSSFDPFADDLITLMDELEINHHSNSTFFVGHSMSAMIGCIASLKRPQLFTRLILLCASPRYINVEGYEGGFRKSDVEGLLSAIESDYESWVSGFTSIAIDPNDVVSREKFRELLLSMGGDVALPLAKTVFCSDHRDLLENVEIPCTIVQTSNDMAVPRSVGIYLEKKIKGKCNLEIIDTIGHFPQLTAHLKLVEVIKGALI